MRFEKLLWNTPLALCLIAGTALSAQGTTGSFSGLVRDAAGKPLAGARVSLDSPALFRTRVLTTDARGEFRDPMLPVGNYAVKISKDGYLGTSVPDLRIGLGASLSQTFTLKTTQVAEVVVEITASSAKQDKTDPKTSHNFSSEMLQSLPVGSGTFQGALDMSPGVVSSDTQTAAGGAIIRGSESISTQYRVNGADFTPPQYDAGATSYSQGVGSYVIMDNVEDVQVVLSSVNARTGRASGGINVVTKSGGNTLAGSLRANIYRPSWRADASDSYRSDLLKGSDNLDKSFEVTLNGPIVKDRLWFALASRIQPTVKSPFYRTNFNQLPEKGGFNSYSKTGLAHVDAQINKGYSDLASQGYAMFFGDMVPENNVPLDTEQTKDHHEARLTWGMTQDLTVEYSIFSDQTKDNYDTLNRNRLVRRWTIGPGKTSNIRQTLSFRGILSPSTFFEAAFSRLDNRIWNSTGDTSVINEDLRFRSADKDGYYNSADGKFVGGMTTSSSPYKLINGGVPSRAVGRLSRELTLNIKQFWTALGDHDTDMGLAVYRAHFDSAGAFGDNNRTFNTGGVVSKNMMDTPDQWRYLAVQWANDYNGTTAAYRDPVTKRYRQQVGSFYSLGPGNSLFQALGQDGRTMSENRSLYVNDAWTLDAHWNVNLGLRWDFARAQDVDERMIGSYGRLSPRVAVRYDLNGDSAHVFTGTAARYSRDYGLTMIRRIQRSFDSKSIFFGWSAFTNLATMAPGSTYAGWVDHKAFFNPDNYKTAYKIINKEKSIRVNPDLQTPFEDEFSLNYRRSFEKSWVSLSYTFKRMLDQYAFSRQWDENSIYASGDPRPNPDGTIVPFNAVATDVFNTDSIKRFYHGVEIQWQANPSPRWSWGGNITWSRLVGNDDIPLETPNNGLLLSEPYTWSGLMQTWGFSQDDYAPMGLLPTNRSLVGSVHVVYALPVGKGRITFSPRVTFASGRPDSIILSYPMGTLPTIPLKVPGTTAGVLDKPPTSWDRYLGGRGNYWSQDTYNTSFKIGLQIPLVAKLRLLADLNISNVFNHHYQTGYNMTTYKPTGGANRLWPIDTAVFGTRYNLDAAKNRIPAYMSGSRAANFSVGLRF